MLNRLLLVGAPRSRSARRLRKSSISLRYRSIRASVSITSFFTACNCSRHQYRAEQFTFIYQNRRQARTWTFLILAAKPRVEVLSPIALVAGLSVHITEMRALPDKQGCSIRVSFELRYGTWSLIFKIGEPIAASGTVKTATYDFPLDAFSASVAITVPRVSRLKYATSQRT